jgi:hypothetical protein
MTSTNYPLYNTTRAAFLMFEAPFLVTAAAMDFSLALLEGGGRRSNRGSNSDEDESGTNIDIRAEGDDFTAAGTYQSKGTNRRRSASHRSNSSRARSHRGRTNRTHAVPMRHAA